MGKQGRKRGRFQEDEKEGKKTGKIPGSSGKGEDSKMASSLLSKNEIRLHSVSGEETEIHYRSDVSVLGTLGKFGEGIMRKKATEVGEQFALFLKSKIETGAEGKR